MGIEVAFGAFPLGFRYGASRAILWISPEIVAVAHGDCVSYFDAATLRELRRTHVGHHVTALSGNASLLLVSTEAAELVTLDRETLEERSRVEVTRSRSAMLHEDGATALVVRGSSSKARVGVEHVVRVRVANGAFVDGKGDLEKVAVGSGAELSPAHGAVSTTQWDGVTVQRVPSGASARVTRDDVSVHAQLSDDALLIGTVKGSVLRVNLHANGESKTAWEFSLGTSPVRRVSAGFGFIGAAAQDGTTVLLDDSGRERARWKLPKESVRAVIPSPDGTRVLVVTQERGDVLATPCLSVLIPSKPKAVAATLPLLAKCAALSAEPSALFVGTEEGEVLSLASSGLSQVNVKSGPVRGLRASVDGASLAVVGKQLTVLDAATLAAQRALKVAGLGAVASHEAARVSFGERATRMTFYSSRRATAVDASSGETLGTLDGEEDVELLASAWSDGALVCVDEGGKLFRRGAKARSLLGDRAKATAAAFSDDGARLAIAWGEGDASRVAVVSMASDAIEREAVVGGRVVALAWSRDQRSIALASDRAFEVRAATLSGEVVRATRPAGYPFDLALSRDGATLWTAIHLALDANLGDAVPGALRAYDAADGAQLGTIVVGVDGKSAAVIVDGAVELLGDAKRAQKLVVSVDRTEVTPLAEAAVREGLLKSLLTR